MTNLAFRRVLISLSHPVSIGAIVLLLFNDHIWRQLAPSWFTGKIGDFTWLIFAPFLLMAILAWLPVRSKRRTEIIGYGSIIGTGLIFGLAKTVPEFHAFTIKVLEALTGWPNILRIDPTDLIALPALLIAAWIWQQSAHRSMVLPNRGWVLLTLAALATIGNTPAAPTGVRSLQMSADSIIYTQGFHSDDDGLTWREGGPKDQAAYAYRSSPWQLTDPVNERVRYRFTRGLSIERSDDGGQTWRREFDLSGEEARVAAMDKLLWDIGPFDAIIHPATGNVIVAMGDEGVLVRLSTGEWRWVTVGNFSVPQLNRFEQITTLLSGEIWLGAALIGLMVASGLVRRRGRIDSVLGALTILTAIGWAITLFSFRPATGNTGPIVNLSTIAVPMVVVFAAIVGLWQANIISQPNSRVLLIVFGLAIGGALVYLLPYVLWTQGAIPFYRSATNWAIGLALVLTLVANRFIHARIEPLPLESREPLEHKTPAAPVPLKTQVKTSTAQLIQALGGLIVLAGSFMTWVVVSGNYSLLGTQIFSGLPMVFGGPLIALVALVAARAPGVRGSWMAALLGLLAFLYMAAYAQGVAQMKQTVGIGVWACLLGSVLAITGGLIKNPIATYQPLTTSPVDTYYTRGINAYEADDYDAALTEFDQALQLKPDHADAYLYRGLTYYAKDDYKLAMTDLEAALSYKPQDAEINYWRGCVYADLGDRPKAIAALQNALQLKLEPKLRPEAEALIDQLRRSSGE